MKFTFGLLAVLSMFTIVAWAEDYEAIPNEDSSEDRRGLIGGGELFTYHLNDCSRQFCPTYKHECCCEGALSGGEACCGVKTNSEVCSLYVCNGEHWECAKGC